MQLLCSTLKLSLAAVWHEAQDTALRAGAVVSVRGTLTDSAPDAEPLCAPHSLAQLGSTHPVVPTLCTAPRGSWAGLSTPLKILLQPCAPHLLFLFLFLALLQQVHSAPRRSACIWLIFSSSLLSACGAVEGVKVHAQRLGAVLVQETSP